MITEIIIALGAAGVGAFITYVNLRPESLPSCEEVLPSLKKINHDIDDLKESSTSTKWKSLKVCPHCHNKISHEESMTDICLSCGKTMPVLASRYAALREIWLDGEWVYNLKHNDVDYILDKNNVWVKYRDYASKEKLVVVLTKEK